MADAKITGLTEDTTPANGDFLVTVDVSDTTDDATGTNKKVQVSNLFTQARTLPSQTGNSGKYLTTDGSTASWNTVSGGGGQTTVTKVVAASGGDYTTLSAALAAASAGWEIKIMPGTYTEGGVSCSLANIKIVGGGNGAAVLNFSSNSLTLSGANLTMRDVQLNFTTGSLIISGNYAVVDGISFVKTGATNLGMLFNSSYGVFANSMVDMSTVATDSALIVVSFYQQQQRIVGNTFRVCNTFSGGGVRIYSSYSVIVGNLFFNYGSSSNSASNPLVYLYDGSASISTVSGNMFKDVNNTATCSLLKIGSPYLAVSGNTFIGEANVGIDIVAGSASNVVITGNVINTRQGIKDGGSNNYRINISGNNMHGWGTANSSYGVYINSSYCIVNNNSIDNYQYGLKIDTGSTKSIVGDNMVVGNGTNYTDSGTSTSASNNVTA